MTRRYIVVRGTRSSCGIHAGSVSWRQCHHCARAAALTAAELAATVPRRRAVGHPNSAASLAANHAVFEHPKARERRAAIVPSRGRVL